LQKSADGKEHNTAEICDSIMNTLVEDLSTWFPLAFVGLIRGGDLIDAMMQMAYAPTVITSASTLSLWAMLGNFHPQGRLFFPTSNLILDAQQHYISNKFFWVDYPRQMVFHEIKFGEGSTVPNILAKLRSVPKRDTGYNAKLERAKETRRPATRHIVVRRPSGNVGTHKTTVEKKEQVRSSPVVAATTKSGNAKEFVARSRTDSASPPADKGHNNNNNNPREHFKKADVPKVLISHVQRSSN
jgi:hypothetical protein